MLWKCCTQYASKFGKLSSGYRTGKGQFSFQSQRTAMPKNIQTFVPWKKSYYQPKQHIKKQRHYFAYKGPSSQSYNFSSSHVSMWELEHIEGWVLKNWCFWTVVLKTIESPLDCKEIQPAYSERDQPWLFIGRTDAETEAPILWPPHVKSQIIRKDTHAGKDWRQEEKGMTEDKMVGWHHRLHGHVFEQAPGDGEGQRGLACCSPWGHKKSDMTEQLNSDNTLYVIYLATVGLCCCTWDLVPQLGIEPEHPVCGAWSPSHWTPRKVPKKVLWIAWDLNIEERQEIGGSSIFDTCLWWS